MLAFSLTPSPLSGRTYYLNDPKDRRREGLYFVHFLPKSNVFWCFFFCSTTYAEGGRVNILDKYVRTYLINGPQFLSMDKTDVTFERSKWTLKHLFVEISSSNGNLENLKTSAYLTWEVDLKCYWPTRAIQSKCWNLIGQTPLTTGVVQSGIRPGTLSNDPHSRHLIGWPLDCLQRQILALSLRSHCTVYWRQRYCLFDVIA